jgi:hypothetical protein
LTLKIHRKCLTPKGWSVLKKLGDLVAKHKFVLAGGTGLALWIGHRISYDLDFFTLHDFRNDALILEIKKTTKNYQVISEEEGSLTLEIEGIKVSFFKYEYPFIAESVRLDQAMLAGILDIAAMKVIAINQRGVKRDFVDLYAILQEIPFHIVARHMIMRFGMERINPVQTGKSLVYFADADTNPDPAYRKGMELNWDHIKKFFRTHVKQYVLDLEAARKKEEQL